MCQQPVDSWDKAPRADDFAVAAPSNCHDDDESAERDGGRWLTKEAALAFYTGVLGCELRYDMEVWPGARMVEVVPPGSLVGLVLLPPDSPLPMAVRLGTTDVDAAHAQLADVQGVVLHSESVLRWEGVAPMFAFSDPDGNGLVYLEDPDNS